MLVPVADRSSIAEARRVSVDLAAKCGLDEGDRGRVGLIATELATNLIKHAQQGMLAASVFDDKEGAGVEILALDKGPGIADLQKALVDGMSTAGTAGQGLGAIRRQSDEFAVYSRPRLGTAVLSRVRSADAPKTGRTVVIGAVNDACPGEMVSGDAWAHASTPQSQVLFLVDGTGHGPLAAAAAAAAIKSFAPNADKESTLAAHNIHRALAPTRGGAIALAQMGLGEKIVRYVGVGNIVGVIGDSSGVKRMVSNHGTAGHLAPRIREFSYPYEQGAVVVLHSDGLSSKWDFKDYPGLMACHPSVIAGVLFRDHRRGRDDATVVAMRAA